MDNSIDRISTVISTPRPRDSTLAKSRQSNPAKALFRSTKLYWSLASASVIIMILMAWSFWPNEVPKPPPNHSTTDGRVEILPPPVIQHPVPESRRVRIGVVGEPAQLYLSQKGEWEGPYKTPYEFYALLGEQIKWKLTRAGFRDKTGNFNVQVDNQYLYTLCKVEEDCVE